MLVKWKSALAAAVIAPTVLLTVALPTVQAAPATGKNVALASAGGTVTASGQEVAGRWGPALVIDGNADSSVAGAQQSRWSSNTDDDASITVKLAAPTVVDHIAIQWEAACAAAYKLQVSTDGVTFIDATGTIRPTCGTRDVQKIASAPAGTAYQYIKMQGIDRTPIGANKYGMSMWEFEVWDGPEAPPVVPAAPLNLVPKPVNVVEHSADAPFTLGANAKIVATGGAVATAEYLASLLRPATGYALPVVSSATGTGNITLTVGTDVAGFAGKDEAYSLAVNANGATISAKAAHGAFNGVQTLRQLFPAFIEAKTAVATAWTASAVDITDAPRFSERGMMLDVARDFKTVEETKAIIDSLAAYKISTLHMHLADDQGWRIQITNDGKAAGDPLDYSKLTSVSGDTAMTQTGFQNELGHTGFYTQDEYKSLVAYAASRHIDVIPEIDVPGHTNAALHALPELNTAGTKPGVGPDGVVPANGTGNVGYSTLDANADITWTFVNHVFKQIADMTPGEYIHIGGDESHSTGHDNYVKFVTKSVEIVHALGKKPIGWNETAIGGLTAGDGIQYWTGGTADTLNAINAKGAKLLVSRGSTAYLDMKYHSKTPIGLTWAGTGDFTTYYNWDPAAVVQDAGANLPDSKIMGVEAPMWSETIRGGEQAEFMAFPRVLSFAEIGWTPQAQRNVNDFKVRMAGMGQRMLVNGTNYYDGNQATWQWSMAGAKLAVSPGKALSLNVGSVSAPGTKAAADGATIAVDSVDDADGASASAITGSLGVVVNWGDGSAATPAVFTTTTARTSLSAGGLYSLAATHSYAAAGTYTGTLTASNGTTSPFTITVAAGIPDPTVPAGWDSSQTPALATDSTGKAGGRADATFSGFEPGKYVDIKLGETTLGSVLPGAAGIITTALPIPDSTYAGTYPLTATQGTRTASSSIKVASALVPLSNKIPQSSITIESFDSQETVGDPGSATNLLDGNPATFWHTQWQGATPAFPHEVVFDLGTSHAVTGFEYTQRNASNGRIKDYELYVSDSPTSFGTAVATGSFLDLTRAQVVPVNGGKVGRYVKLKGLNAIAGNAFAGGAEVNIGGIDIATLAPEIDTDGVDSIEAGKDVDLALSGFAPYAAVEVALAPANPALRAAPVVLDTLTADGSGAVSGSVTIPQETPAGEHDLVASSGAVSASRSLTVTAVPVATPEPTDPPTTPGATTPPTDPGTTTPPVDPGTTTPPGGGSGSGNGGAGSGSSDNGSLGPQGSGNTPLGTEDELSNTGSASTPLLLGSLLLMGAGAATLLLRRRKRATHS